MHTALPRWSPDGEQIVFMGQYPGRPWSVFLVRADGGVPEQLTDWNDATAFNPTWSPDGKSLAVGFKPIHILNLATRRLSVLPGSNGVFSPRWSPDGRYIAALSRDQQTLLLFNLKSQRWTELAKANLGNLTWSKDSEYMYFDTNGSDAAFFRVRIRNRKIDRVVNLKDVERTVGTFGGWTGLAPDGSPLIQRDASFDEIYALDWEAP
jgi:Tol biopolymer transport system component